METVRKLLVCRVCGRSLYSNSLESGCFQAFDAFRLETVRLDLLKLFLCKLVGDLWFVDCLETVPLQSVWGFFFETDPFQIVFKFFHCKLWKLLLLQAVCKIFIEKLFGKCSFINCLETFYLHSDHLRTFRVGQR